MNAPALSAKEPRVGGSAVGLALYVAAALAAITSAVTVPFSAYALNLLMQASTYAIAVLGLTIVLGYTGQINLAQAAFFGLGAYSVALGTTPSRCRSSSLSSSGSRSQRSTARCWASRQCASPATTSRW
jgi:ABC-type branched-subunit amino acid transport system permease subunit